MTAEDPRERRLNAAAHRKDLLYRACAHAYGMLSRLGAFGETQLCAQEKGSDIYGSGTRIEPLKEAGLIAGSPALVLCGRRKQNKGTHQRASRSSDLLIPENVESSFENNLCVSCSERAFTPQ